MPMRIDGAWVEAADGAVDGNRSPADGRGFATVPDGRSRPRRRAGAGSRRKPFHARLPGLSGQRRLAPGGGFQAKAA